MDVGVIPAIRREDRRSEDDALCPQLLEVGGILRQLVSSADLRAVEPKTNCRRSLDMDVYGCEGPGVRSSRQHISRPEQGSEQGREPQTDPFCTLCAF